MSCRRRSANTTSNTDTWTTVQLEREFFIDNLLVRIHFIIVMIRWTGLEPWEFELGLTSNARAARNPRSSAPHFPARSWVLLFFVYSSMLGDIRLWVGDIRLWVGDIRLWVGLTSKAGAARNPRSSAPHSPVRCRFLRARI